jgi:hypothetical protein
VSERLYTDFVHDCYDVGIQLDWSLMRSLPKTTDTAFYPNQWMAAWRQGNTALSVQQVSQLASSEIPEALIGSEASYSQLALVGLINNSINRTDSAEVPSDHWFIDSPSTISNHCARAELTFGQTFELMSQVVKGVDQDPELLEIAGWRIYYDMEREPIVVKKCHDIQSSLSLVPLTIDGITYPAGSILYINQSRISKADIFGNHLFVGSRQTASVASLHNMHCRRISGFAVPPDQRLANGFDNFPPYRATSLDELRTIARAALTHSTDISGVLAQ